MEIFQLLLGLLQKNLVKYFSFLILCFFMLIKGLIALTFYAQLYYSNLNFLRILNTAPFWNTQKNFKSRQSLRTFAKTNSSRSTCFPRVSNTQSTISIIQAFNQLWINNFVYYFQLNAVIIDRQSCKDLLKNKTKEDRRKICQTTITITTTTNYIRVGQHLNQR